MPADIAACGSIGVARETTPGTYVAPTKFFPIMNESLTWAPQQSQRRGIRKTADILGVIPSTFTVAGDIEMEAFEEILPYFLMAARTNAVKTGATNYTYEFVGANCGGLGTLGKTLSITIVRNGTVEAYVGCQVGSFRLYTQDSVLMFSCSIIGLDEASQSAPTETYATTLTPFGAGMWDIEIPNATDVSDVETFEFTVEDNLTAAHRLRAVAAPAFLHYGERTVSMTATRDFLNRTDYDAMKARTPQDIEITATKGVNNQVIIQMPVAYKETYEFNLTAQADLITASIAYFGAVDATVGGAYKITVKTQENIS